MSLEAGEAQFDVLGINSFNTAAPQQQPERKHIHQDRLLGLDLYSERNPQGAIPLALDVNIFPHLAYP